MNASMLRNWCMKMRMISPLSYSYSSGWDCVYLLNCRAMYVPFDVVHLHPILNQYDNWLWRCCISRTDLADTASVVTNAVVLVRGSVKCQWQRTSGSIYPCIEWYWNILGIDNVTPLYIIIVDRHARTHAHTHIRTHAQHQDNYSFATSLRIS